MNKIKVTERKLVNVDGESTFNKSNEIIEVNIVKQNEFFNIIKGVKNGCHA